MAHRGSSHARLVERAKAAVLNEESGLSPHSPHHSSPISDTSVVALGKHGVSHWPGEAQSPGRLFSRAETEALKVAMRKSAIELERLSEQHARTVKEAQTAREDLDLERRRVKRLKGHVAYGLCARLALVRLNNQLAEELQGLSRELHLEQRACDHSQLSLALRLCLTQMLWKEHFSLSSSVAVWKDSVRGHTRRLQGFGALRSLLGHSLLRRKHTLLWVWSCKVARANLQGRCIVQLRLVIQRRGRSACARAVAFWIQQSAQMFHEGVVRSVCARHAAIEFKMRERCKEKSLAQLRLIGARRLSRALLISVLCWRDAQREEAITIALEEHQLTLTDEWQKRASVQAEHENLLEEMSGMIIQGSKNRCFVQLCSFVGRQTTSEIAECLVAWTNATRADRLQQAANVAAQVSKHRSVSLLRLSIARVMAGEIGERITCWHRTMKEEAQLVMLKSISLRTNARLYARSIRQLISIYTRKVNRDTLTLLAYWRYSVNQARLQTMLVSLDQAKNALQRNVQHSKVQAAALFVQFRGRTISGLIAVLVRHWTAAVKQTQHESERREALGKAHEQASANASKTQSLMQLSYIIGSEPQEQLHNLVLCWKAAFQTEKNVFLMASVAVFEEARNGCLKGKGVAQLRLVGARWWHRECAAAVLHWQGAIEDEGKQRTAAAGSKATAVKQLGLIVARKAVSRVGVWVACWKDATDQAQRTQVFLDLCKRKCVVQMRLVIARQMREEVGAKLLLWRDAMKLSEFLQLKQSGAEQLKAQEEEAAGVVTRAVVSMVTEMDQQLGERLKRKSVVQLRLVGARWWHGECAAAVLHWRSAVQAVSDMGILSKKHSMILSRLIRWHRIQLQVILLVKSWREAVKASKFDGLMVKSASSVTELETTLGIVLLRSAHFRSDVRQLAISVHQWRASLLVLHSRQQRSKALIHAVSTAQNFLVAQSCRRSIQSWRQAGFEDDFKIAHNRLLEEQAVRQGVEEAKFELERQLETALKQVEDSRRQHQHTVETHSKLLDRREDQHTHQVAHVGMKVIQEALDELDRMDSVLASSNMAKSQWMDGERLRQARVKSAIGTVDTIQQNVLITTNLLDEALKLSACQDHHNCDLGTCPRCGDLPAEPTSVKLADRFDLTEEQRVEAKRFASRLWPEM